MTDSPAILLAAGAPKKRPRVRFLTPARYRHPDDVIRLIAATLVLGAAAVIVALLPALLRPAAAVTGVGPATGRVLTGLVQVMIAAAAALMAGITYLAGRIGPDRAVATAPAAIGASGVAAVVPLLIVVFFALAGHDLTKAFQLPSASKILLALAVIIAVIGVVLATRPGRRWTRKQLLPGVRSAAGSLRQAAASPVKLALLFGGSAVITLAYIAALTASVQAFGGGPGLIVLGAVYLAAAALAAAAPTPGGLGAIEAARVAGLTGVGMSAGPAVSAVLLYRLATYWLPVLPGWLCWRSLQHREYM